MTEQRRRVPGHPLEELVREVVEVIRPSWGSEDRAAVALTTIRSGLQAVGRGLSQLDVLLEAVELRRREDDVQPEAAPSTPDERLAYEIPIE